MKVNLWFPFPWGMLRPSYQVRERSLSPRGTELNVLPGREGREEKINLCNQESVQDQQ